MATNKPINPNDNGNNGSSSNIGSNLPEQAGQLADQAKTKLSEMGTEASAAMHRVSGQVEDMARRTLDRARETSAQVRERIGRASDATVTYIKDEPVKAVMIAAATGAVTALLISWLARSRSDR